MELARNANGYAERHLLRGRQGLTGGRIPLSRGEIQSMKLGPALSAGLLVAS